MTSRRKTIFGEMWNVDNACFCTLRGKVLEGYIITDNKATLICEYDGKWQKFIVEVLFFKLNCYYESYSVVTDVRILKVGSIKRTKPRKNKKDLWIILNEGE